MSNEPPVTATSTGVPSPQSIVNVCVSSVPTSLYVPVKCTVPFSSTDVADSVKISGATFAIVVVVDADDRALLDDAGEAGVALGRETVHRRGDVGRGDRRVGPGPRGGRDRGSKRR